MLMMLPLFVLQFFAGSIMLSLGLTEDIARQVGIYCRLMVVPAILLLIDTHYEIIFINIGYEDMAALNSFITGIGVRCFYIAIFNRPENALESVSLV